MSRTVLITGGATRIGGVISKGLTADGWTVIIHYGRSQNAAKGLVEELKSNGGQAVAVGCNLNVPQDLNTLVERSADAAGKPLTALINNASVFNNDAADNFSSALFDHHMIVNLKAPLLLAQAFARQLPKENQGNIINLIDQRVLKPDPDFFTYSLSKSGLKWATQTMAQSYAPNIRVNAIGPGPTLKNHMQSDAEFEQEKASTLLGDGSPPDQILHGVRYLLSATAVTGQMIAVDGGQHLSG